MRSSDTSQADNERIILFHMRGASSKRYYSGHIKTSVSSQLMVSKLSPSAPVHNAIKPSDVTTDQSHHPQYTAAAAAAVCRPRQLFVH